MLFGRYGFMKNICLIFFFSFSQWLMAQEEYPAHLECSVNYNLLNFEGESIDDLSKSIDDIMVTWDKEIKSNDLKQIIEEENDPEKYRITKMKIVNINGKDTQIAVELTPEEYKVMFEKTAKDVEILYFKLLEYTKRKTTVDPKTFEIKVDDPEDLIGRGLRKVEQLVKFGSFSAGEISHHFNKIPGDESKKQADEYHVKFIAMKIRGRELAYDVSSIKQKMKDDAIINSEKKFIELKGTLSSIDLQNPKEVTKSQLAVLKELKDKGNNWSKAFYGAYLMRFQNTYVEGEEMLKEAANLAAVGSLAWFVTKGVTTAEEQMMWFGRLLRYGKNDDDKIFKRYSAILRDSIFPEYERNNSKTLKAFSTLPEFEFHLYRKIKK
jgi:hypothetical protein